jgi:poly(3-hydroxybutyrate) depolymerase
MQKSLSLIVFAITLSTAALAQQAPFPTGAHQFDYTDKGARGEVTIEVPAVAGSACARKACPLVIGMPGLTRNALQTRDNWLNIAEEKGLIMVSPFLDSKRFPTRLYQQGGVVGEPDRAKWLYNTIERLYDHLVAQGRAEPGGYILFGHSAGAQFVHRMVLAMPEARYKIAITANAGFYTLPTSAKEAGGHPIPFSLEGTPITEADRAKALQRPMILMLGDQDIDPNHYQLNNSDGAKAQGPHRFARGHFFFAASEAEATRLGVPFGWKKIVVPGVDHDNTRMAKAAADAIWGK